MIADEAAAIRIMRESNEVLARLLRGEDAAGVRARGHSVIAAATQWQARAADRQRHTSPPPRGDQVHAPGCSAGITSAVECDLGCW